MSGFWKKCGAWACLGFFGFAGGCATESVYQLPTPQEQSEAEAETLVPEGDKDAPLPQAQFVEARESMGRLRKLLDNVRYDEALELMSRETQDFLAYGSADSDPVTTLASGEMKLPDGRSITFEPVSFLLAPDLSEVSDEAPSMGDDPEVSSEEHETARRKVLWAATETGTPRRIVMIKEGDQWVLHRTAIPQDLLKEK